ncbi:AAA family ATPase [Paenibacillus mendelii]|uniref:Nuclease SbcCD subunit C n=1 Tax=Paenibacillus mendelii TaxID=206163 RepID=A0ABV6JHS8_9BACL|nr:AAA family ATPase [Paenibacillus mendelii]MCQ6558338.1 AAA family ATPase [Paenibacillus mendelii]
MKPILLRLSGLQSYRAMQEVDFGRLCEAGVFGIFGSTGSGKSSILDAVTLALYGKVERAANGTQGIMNHAEKQLSVGFTFELSGSGEHRRYRVERQFKRGGDVSVSNTLSRFVEVTGDGEIVLADKLSDVTRCVEDRIGLNMQDFTRAVVLPQGKFAEFLSLTGKDRRQMLQRLFRLERFGDGLALKLNQRMKAAEAALNEAVAEQHGLGDASAAAVDAAAERHREAAAAAAAARAALAEAERLHAERLHVRERQEALRAKEALQAKLLADAPRIAERERELQRLSAAERLVPAMDAAEAAEAALRAAASRREAAGRAHAALQEAAAGAAAALAAASAEAAAAEPRLAQRLEQLAGAQRLEGEAAALASSVEGGERRHADAASRQLSFGEQAAKAEETLGRAQAKQGELKAELKKTELAVDERERRSALAKRLIQLGSLREQRVNADHEASGQKAALARIRDAHAKADSARADAATALLSALNSLNPIRQDLRVLEHSLQRAGDRLPARIEQARIEYREQQRMLLAAQLSEGLEDGTPCPVCGSCEHTRLHRGSDEEEKQRLVSADTMTDWEKLQQRTQGLLLKLSPLRSKADAAYERLIESLSAMDPMKQGLGAEEAWQLEAAAGREESALAIKGRDEQEQDLDNRALTAFDTLLDTSLYTYTALEQSFAGLESGIGRLRTSFLEAQRSCESAAGELRSQTAVERSAHDKAVQLQAAEADELLQWKQQFGEELLPELAQQTLDEYERRENAAHELRVRLDKSVTFIDDTNKLIAGHRLEQQTAQLAVVELAAKLDSQKEQLAEKRVQLHALTGGLPASELLAAAEKELEELRTRLQRLKTGSESAQAALQEAAELRSAAVEGERSATERQNETAASWIAALEASPFTSGAEVASLRILLAQQEAIAAEIARFREEEQQLTAQIELLRDQLAGRTVTDDQWEQCLNGFTQARELNETALQTAARADRDLEELKTKQERWMQLETKRTSMDALCGRLKSLQTVFRGNAFVEYVAEEQLVQVCHAASERLGYLTKRRYALEVDSGGGFVIRDDANGGIRRPVSTLSGGETFLASLALALALSGQIQLRGKYPLQFFFLDEGFGTLDPELLDTVITALEKLHTDRLSVGVISHVPELRARLPRRLIVTAAEPSGLGSVVALETM